VGYEFNWLKEAGVLKHIKSLGGTNKSNVPSVPPDISRAGSNQGQEAKFRGWQFSPNGLFPLYNVLKKDNESFGSTVTEKTLQALHLRTPRTPSPYPEVAPSPWHKLGFALASPASAREALEASGLDFTVAKLPLENLMKPDHRGDASQRWATMRADTGDLLGIVGENYEPVQNRDAFGFFDRLVGEGEAIYETAGALGRGERIWILAKLPGYIKVRDKDIVSKYLLLSNSHDGSSLVQMKLTPIRVVCNNTLTAALKGAGEINIRHTLSAKDDAAQALSLLGVSNFLYEQLEAVFNRMALTKITEAQLLNYFRVLVPDSEEMEDKTNVEETRNTLLGLYENGQGANLSRGTLWGAFNCVAEYTDHALESVPSNRLESIWSGRGDQLNRKAFYLAEQLM
jgi:phage/plasmid-like protein (TIGR03299 family)